MTEPKPLSLDQSHGVKRSDEGKKFYPPGSLASDYGLPPAGEQKPAGMYPETHPELERGVVALTAAPQAAMALANQTAKPAAQSTANTGV